jgi:hypothetical protein
MDQYLRAYDLALSRTWQAPSHHRQTSGKTVPTLVTAHFHNSLAQESNVIMEKEDGLLAGCPRAVAVGEILSRGLRMNLPPAGEQFRRFSQVALISSLRECFAEVVS